MTDLSSTVLGDFALWSTVGDQPEPLENLVARRIREQLGEGGLDALIQAQNAVQAALGGAPIQADASLRVEGKLDVTVKPASAQLNLIPGTPEVSVIPGEVVVAIRSAFPELAKEIEIRSPQDAMLIITLFMGLLQALQTLLALYQIVHGQPPPQPQIVEIFNQTYNVVINAPRG